ncbi:MAG: TlpA disulfide reductase family protein [Phycisphaerae bacterium]|nr:TlpA disulfide reductase family protein [Phycisphaerae bacterium]MDD5380101.1 TlpA disulfide reductase family protein [Phycisphaerae bacterium]
MSKKNNQLSSRLVFVISIIILAVTPALPGCKKQPASEEAVKQTQTEDNNKPSSSAPTVESLSSPAVAESKASPNNVIALPQAKPKTDIIEGPNTAPKTNLRDVIMAARTWGAVYTHSFGQKAPDFTLTDINGKQHKLSDYRGKDVLINVWATWCPPCRIELPHLIALRNQVSEDKLAILAISYKTAYPPETAEKVKSFAEQNKINYTVFSADAAAMPPLFTRMTSIPCSFFIDPEGKIKLITEGLLSLGEIKAILQAE